MRVLTLKNAAWVFGGLFVLFIAYSSYHELRPRSASRDRLYERGINAPPATPVREPMEVIEEGRPSYRESSLATASPDEPARPLPQWVPPPEKPIATLKATRERGERTVITGGAEGLRVDVRPSTTTTETAAPPEPF